MRRRGIVRGIRRQDGEVDALVDGALVAARYNPNRMPWPLCLAVFEQYQPGSWRCVGPIGHRELLFHDDFLCVNSGTGYGDTFWSVATSSGSGTVAAASTAVGAVRLTTPVAGTVATDVRLEKDDGSVSAPSDHWVLWASMRAAPVDDEASPRIGWNLYSDYIGSPLPEKVELVGGDTFVAGLTCSDGSTSSDTTTPKAFYATGTFNTYDLLWCGGRWVAGWVDGDGPYVLKASIPGVANPMPFGVGAQAPALEALSCDIDWASLSCVTPCVDPASV